MSSKLKKIIEVNNNENNNDNIIESKPIDIKPKKKRKTRKNNTDKVKIHISENYCFCLRCRKSVECLNKNISIVNNRKRMTGNCQCGTKLHKFMKKD